MRLILGLLLLSLSISEISGQYIHLSQFNTTPLLLNPSLTGNFDNTAVRSTLAYRNQWPTFGKYKTLVASVDANFLRKQLKGHSMGGGLLAYRDVAGDGDFRHTFIGGSLAYHALLGKHHTLSAGFQGAFIHINIDPDILDPNDPVRDDFPKNSANISLGLNWSAVWDRIAFGLGASYFKLTQPESGFLQPARYAIHGHTQIALGSNIILTPTILYMSAPSAFQINGGATLGVYLGSVGLHMGLRTRFVGETSKPKLSAYIPLLGVEYKQFVVGISSDLYTGLIGELTQPFETMELSLTYNGNSDKRIRAQPRF